MNGEFTRARARQHCRRTIRRIDDDLLRMAGHWGDLDNGIIMKIDEIRTCFYELGSEMDESVAEERGEAP